jgi:hypothetical protein
MPLSVDLALATKGEAVQLFVVTNVGKYRLHCADALAVGASPVRAVNGALHRFGGLMRTRLVLVEEGHLPHRRLLGCAQALRAKLTGLAVAFAAGELVMRPSLDHAVCAIAVHRLTSRANTGVRLRVVREVLRSEQPGGVCCARGGGALGLVVERIGSSEGLSLTRKPPALGHSGNLLEACCLVERDHCWRTREVRSIDAQPLGHSI